MKPRSSNKPPGLKTSLKRSVCPIACTLDLLGDKWTLLLVRDLLMFDKRLYSEILQSAENIPTNILADRLKRLEEAGIITKKPYQQNPVRYAYRLTSAGITLGPILKEMAHWANQHIPHAAVIPDELMQRLHVPGKISVKRSR
jgi:DNA-binding HxlR family transcriptional regulator